MLIFRQFTMLVVLNQSKSFQNATMSCHAYNEDAQGVTAHYNKYKRHNEKDSHMKYVSCTVTM